MLPIIKYPGGKKNEISLFKDWIPEKFNTYIEPFVGGGAVYFYLENKKNIINDINEDLINFYKKISTDSDNLIKELKLMKNNKDFYLEIRKMYNENDTSKFSKEAMFYYLNRTCYGGIVRYNSKKEFNTPFGKYSTYKPWEYISDEHVNLLKNTQFMSKSFEEAFKKVVEDGDTAVLQVVIHEGRNRQVRRMFAAAGMCVKRLIRISEGDVTLEDLPLGRWRYLTDEEVHRLKMQF